jgi:glycerol-3-phosphate dehydrogenase
MKLSTYSWRSVLGGLIGAVLATAAYAAAPHEAPMRDFASSTVTGWISNPMVIEAVKAQNDKHAALSQGEIDKLDKQWRAETSSSDRPLIDAVLAKALSKFLDKVKNGTQGLVTEVFVMDNKGLNVGQSDVTSDYWQGDEAKWKKTYLAGPDALFIDEVEQDESTQTFQSQLSMSIADPATGEVIGSITVGVNIDALM